MIAKRQPYKIIPYPNRKNIGKIIPNPHREPKEGEDIAAAILVTMGGDVKFLSELHIPSIKNPDCEWRGIIWEIKTLYGNNYENTKSAVHVASKQSSNIIINAHLTSRDINRVALDVCHYLTSDIMTYSIKQVLILGKNHYSIIKRSMLK